jgi:hypothetical protein
MTHFPQTNSIAIVILGTPPKAALAFTWLSKEIISQSKTPYFRSFAFAMYDPIFA